MVCIGEACWTVVDVAASVVVVVEEVVVLVVVVEEEVEVEDVVSANCVVVVEVEAEVAAVLARERVHRLPFTVVTSSWGVAMQATGDGGKKRRQGLKKREEKKGLQAPRAL